MSFGQPIWLVAGALAVAAFLLLHRWSDRRRAEALARFAHARLLGELTASLSPVRRRVKRALLAAVLALLFAALAEPQVGFDWEETHRRGIDVLIALDVSRSMLARDTAPDRMTRAKLAITDLAERLPDDRLGLVAFAGTAFLQCPLTLDHAAFQQSLDALEPGIIPAPGSDLASALRVTAEALASEKRNVKLVVLVSDGEDLGGAAIREAERIAAEGVRVYTIGVGSAGGELIPVPGARGGTEFVKDEAGQYVKSRLDEETLRRVAEVTGGFYEPLGTGGQGIDAVVERAIAPIPKEELAARMRRVPIDRFQWPLAGALVLLALELLVSERRGALARSSRLAFLSGRRRTTATLLVASLAGPALLPPGHAAASTARAAELFASGDYPGALAGYKTAAEGDPDDARLDFNVGASAYKAGRFDEAAAAFARALRAESPKLQEQSFYNLGNAQFRVGEQQVERDPAKAMKSLRQSVEAYDRALELAGEDATTTEDARHNREIAAAALAKLEEQQRQEQEKRDQEKEEAQDQKETEKDQQQAGDHEGKEDEGEQAREEPGQEQQAEGGQPKKGEPGGEPNSGDEQAAQANQQHSPAEEGAPKEQDARPPGEKDAAATASADAKGADGGSPGESATPSGDEAGSAAASAAAPGQLSASEAQQLLDALRSEERKVPLVAGSAGKPGAGARVRDW